MLGTVLEYYKNGRGNGRLTNEIINEAGQNQESGRDQGHTQDGLEHLTETAPTLYHALGITEVFTMEKHRLRAGLEYTAKFNLGGGVPSTPNCGAYPKSGWSPKAISNSSGFSSCGRWELRALGAKGGDGDQL